MCYQWLSLKLKAKENTSFADPYAKNILPKPRLRYMHDGTLIKLSELFMAGILDLSSKTKRTRSKIKDLNTQRKHEIEKQILWDWGAVSPLTEMNLAEKKKLLQTNT